jgi:hypothetical protein
MRLAARGGEIAYKCQRQWPGPRVTSRVRIGVGDRFGSGVDDRDHPSPRSGSVQQAAPAAGSRAPPAWPLHRAEVIMVDDHLIAAAELNTITAPTLPPGVDEDWRRKATGDRKRSELVAAAPRGQRRVHPAA